MHVGVCVCKQMCVCIKHTLAHLYVYTRGAELYDQHHMYNPGVTGCYTAVYVVRLCDDSKMVPGFPYTQFPPKEISGFAKALPGTPFWEYD